MTARRHCSFGINLYACTLSLYHIMTLGKNQNRVCCLCDSIINSAFTAHHRTAVNQSIFRHCYSIGIFVNKLFKTDSERSIDRHGIFYFTGNSHILMCNRCVIFYNVINVKPCFYIKNSDPYRNRYLSRRNNSAGRFIYCYNLISRRINLGKALNFKFNVIFIITAY